MTKSQDRVATHPCVNDKGQIVHIKHPHSPTSRESWHDENAIATFVPAGECPDEINGIALAPWDDHPEGDDWDDVDGQMEDLEEPAMQLKVGLEPASGCVIEEPDGRVWVVSPTNQYGGYKNTFPKGKIQDEMSWQANAIKEAYEESGLQVRIIGLIGDVNRTTTVTRYYRAVRVGGMPVDMGWESQAAHLVPIDQLQTFLDSPNDHQVVTLAYGRNQVKKAYQPGMEDSLADNYLGNPDVVTKLASEFCSGAMSLMDSGKDSFKAGIPALIERYADIFSGRSADYRSQVGFNETTLPIRCMVDLGDFWQEQRGAWGDDPVRVFLWWLVCHLVEARARADGDEMLLGVMFKPNLQAFVQKVLGTEKRMGP